MEKTIASKTGIDYNFNVTVQPSAVIWVNHACMNEHMIQSMSEAPDYEQS